MVDCALGDGWLQSAETGQHTHTYNIIILHSLTSDVGTTAAVGTTARQAVGAGNSAAAAAAIRCRFHFVIQGWLSTASMGSRQAG